MNEYAQVLENIDLKNKNTYHIGGKAKYYLTPYKDKIIPLLTLLEKENIPWYILGKGSNVILPDCDFDGAILSLDNYQSIYIQDDLCYVEAGCSLNSLVTKTLDAGYINLYFLKNIPGTLGAAIQGNVGSDNHEIFEYVKNVTIIDENKQIKAFTRADIVASYRFTEFKQRKIIILKACLELKLGDVLEAKKKITSNLDRRRKTQPLDTRNAGSVFANPPTDSAGRLIEEAGLKGRKEGGAEISTKHANFIINKENATSKDIKKLISIIKKEIKEKYDITLELEQVIVDWWINGKESKEKT